jgi:hypothetical protein
VAISPQLAFFAALAAIIASVISNLVIEFLVKIISSLGNFFVMVFLPKGVLKIESLRPC